MSAAESWTPVDLDSDPLEPSWLGDPAELHDAYAELLELLKRPAWHAQAACRGQGPKAWFPTRGDSLATLRSICATCPVQEECHAAAMAEPSTFGVWGGMSAEDRKDIRAGRPIRADRRPLRPVRHHLPVPTAEVVAFVESTPALTWPERLERWNAEHTERPFSTADALASAWRYRQGQVA